MLIQVSLQYLETAVHVIAIVNIRRSVCILHVHLGDVWISERAFPSHSPNVALSARSAIKALKLNFSTLVRSLASRLKRSRALSQSTENRRTNLLR